MGKSYCDNCWLVIWSRITVWESWEKNARLFDAFFLFRIWFDLSVAKTFASIKHKIPFELELRFDVSAFVSLAWSFSNNAVYFIVACIRSFVRRFRHYKFHHRDIFSANQFPSNQNSSEYLIKRSSFWLNLVVKCKFIHLPSFDHSVSASFMNDSVRNRLQLHSTAVKTKCQV